MSLLCSYCQTVYQPPRSHHRTGASRQTCGNHQCITAARLRTLRQDRPRSTILLSRECPECGVIYRYHRGRLTLTCGRKACALRRWQRGMRDSRGQNQETWVDPKVLAERGPAYHHCGRLKLYGTTGDGQAVEVCDPCGYWAVIPRRLALEV